jgi:ArsR family transcriptional regulator
VNTSSHVRRVQTKAQGRTARALIGEGRIDDDVRDRCDVDVIHLDAVRDARAALPDDIRLAQVAELLALLSSPTRLKLLLALQPKARGPRRELCVCDLATVAGASKSLTSHQLRLLRGAGIVTVRRSGKLAYYRLADGPAVDLLADALTIAVR